MQDIFDAHCHIGYINGELHSAQQLLHEMDRNHVGMALVSSTDEGEHQSVQEGNDRILEAVSRHPDRFVPFAYVDPTVASGCVEELERVLAAGVAGVKLKPKAQGFSPSDKLLRRVIEFCSENGLPVFIHTGTVLTPIIDRICLLARQFPTVRFVVSHCSHNGYSEEAVSLCAGQQNILFDTADTPPRRVIDTIRLFSPDRVLFGSGWPFCSMRFERAKINALVRGFPDIEFRFNQTLARLVPQFDRSCSCG